MERIQLYNQDWANEFFVYRGRRFPWEDQLRLTEIRSLPETRAGWRYLLDLNFKPGETSGHWNTYYPSGKKECEGIYLNGRKDSTFYIWDEEGVLREELPYLDDKLNGTVKKWDKTGRLIYSVIYYDNKKSGPFFEMKTERDGKELTTEGFYDNNLKEGFCRYFRNGFRREGYYHEGKVIGETKEYYPNGALFATVKALENPPILYFNSALKNSQVCYRTVYFANGNRQFEGWVVEKNEVLRKTGMAKYESSIGTEWFSNGRVKKEKIQEGLTETYREFFSNGHPEILRIEDDGRQRMFKEWYPTGQLKIETQKPDDFNFIHREFYRDGTLKKERILEPEGLRHFYLYSPEGTLKLAHHYKFDEPVSLWIKTRRGKVIQTYYHLSQSRLEELANRHQQLGEEQLQHWERNDEHQQAFNTHWRLQEQVRSLAPEMDVDQELLDELDRADETRHRLAFAFHDENDIDQVEMT